MYSRKNKFVDSKFHCLCVHQLVMLQQHALQHVFFKVKLTHSSFDRSGSHFLVSQKSALLADVLLRKFNPT